MVFIAWYSNYIYISTEILDHFYAYSKIHIEAMHGILNYLKYDPVDCPYALDVI